MLRSWDGESLGPSKGIEIIMDKYLEFWLYVVDVLQLNNISKV